MAMEDVLGRCIEKWCGEDIPLCPPISEAEVRRVWDRFGQSVSEDILTFYGGVGGFADGHSDEDFFWFLWPLDRIEDENASFPSAGVQFCDHSIQVATWELRREDERHSSVWMVDCRKPGWSEMTATSLESFLQMYLEDPWKLM